MPIAVVEHHRMLKPGLSPYDIAGCLGHVWEEIQTEAHINSLTLEADSVLAINERIAISLNAAPGEFIGKDDWSSFIRECGSIEDDPTRTFSWILSALYWNHLTRFRLATAWLYTNALRKKLGFPEYRLTLDLLGPFLKSLSGSGPPLYDGQTFFPEHYSVQ